jgi:hypothetical protein
MMDRAAYEYMVSEDTHLIINEEVQVDGEVILNEAVDFKKLKKNQKPLTDEERKKCMDAKAVWHHGPGGKASPAVWKSVDPKTEKVTFVTNTHRAFNAAPSVEGAISRFHKFIKGTA